METHNGSYALGMLFGILVACLVIWAIGRVINRRYGKGRREYDERQKLAQGKAYKWAFFVLLGYLILGSVFDLATGIRWCDRFTFAFIGTLLAVLVFAVLCIVDDAYMPFSENPRRVIWILGIIGGFNTILGAVNLFTPGAVIVNGVLTYRCVNLLSGLLVLGVTAAILFKAAAEKRARAEEA